MLFFIPKAVTDTKVCGQTRKTGTVILSQLTCKSCRRVFHKRSGLKLHSCKAQPTMQQKPTQTKAFRKSSPDTNNNLNKKNGLRLPSLKASSIKQHKASQLRSPSKKKHDKLPISSNHPKESFLLPLCFDFPLKQVEVKLRRLKSHPPAPPSNDSFNPSFLQARLKRIKVKLQRCEVPSSFSA